MDMIDVTVIICTLNRADMLRETLESYAVMADACSTKAELLIVNNGSTDHTEEVARAFLGTHELGRYVTEVLPGLSHARNTGLRESRGAIVAYADDDVFFEPGWLDAIASAFREHRDASAVGGHTAPEFEDGMPTWLHPDFAYMYGSTDSGEEPRWMEYPEHPFGVNMAFRRSVLLEMNGFNPNLGRIRGCLLSGEESHLFWRMQKSGKRFWYTPHAALRHRIPIERTSPKWVLQRSHWQGISMVLIQQLQAPKNRAALVIGAATMMLRLARSLAGGNFSPRLARWHFLNLPFHIRVGHAYLKGRIRQSLREAFRLRRLVTADKA